jgi:hypothetical protein
VLYRVWNQHEGDFWSVAVPGVATGGGTLVLAAVTVWLSSTQRARDDFLRRDDLSRRDEERRQAESQAALREARKVITYWRRDSSGNEEIYVVNAGVESVIDVHLIRAGVQSEAAATISWWEWHPEDLVDEFDRYRAPSWYCPFVLPGAVVSFRGRMMESTSDGSVSKARIGELGRRVTVEVAWSDATGRYWKLAGPGQLLQLPEPYLPSDGD